MIDLLNHPAVQAGVIPFVVGIVLALALWRSRFLVLVPWAAFIAVVALALDFSIEPLTSVRKLVLVGLAGGALALGLEAAAVRPAPAVRAVLAALAAAAGLWMVSRVLGQLEGAALGWTAAGVAAYGAALTASLLLTPGDTLRTSVAMAVVALASGAVALLNASASMAQIGIALGASSGALVLMAMLRGERAPPGLHLALPVALVCGALGTGSVVTGGGSWWALLPMPLIAVAVRLVRVEGRAPWLAAIVCGVAAIVPATAAVVLAWQRIGAPPG